MVQPIRSGLRDVQPTDFGVGSVIQDLKQTRQRREFKEDRDFQVKLQDERFIEQIMLDLGKQGVVMNDRAIEQMRDRLADAQGTNTIEYRQAKADLLAEFQKNQSDHTRFIQGVDYYMNDMKARPEYYKPEAYAMLQSAIQNRDYDAIARIKKEGMDSDQYFKDKLSEHIQLANRYRNVMIDETLVSRGGLMSTDLHEINANGNIVNRKIEDIHIEAIDAMARGEGIDPDMYQIINDEVANRLAEAQADAVDGNVSAENQRFLDLDTNGRKKAILLEKAFGYFAPSEERPSGIRTKASTPYGYTKDVNTEKNEKEELSWLIPENNGFQNILNNYEWENEDGGVRFARGEIIKDGTNAGKYKITVFYKGEDEGALSSGLFKKPKVWKKGKTIWVNPADEGSLNTSLNAIRLASTSKKKELTGGGSANKTYIDSSGNEFTIDELNLTQKEIDALVANGDLKIK